MIDNPVDALEQAIALYRAPSRLSRLQERPLGNTLLLLRIAANDRAAIADAIGATGETEDTVVGSARLYIQQVLFAETADAYHLLGARPDDSSEQIKEHYRWLMRWLHPDRQPERWEVVYSDRVNQAWQILRSPERRTAYDLLLHSTISSAARERQLPLRHRANDQSADRALLSPQTKRRLPQLILGGLGLGAFIVLGLLYDSQEQAPLSAETASGLSTPALPVEPAPVVAVLQTTRAPQLAALSSGVPTTSAVPPNRPEIVAASRQMQESRPASVAVLAPAPIAANATPLPLVQNIPHTLATAHSQREFAALTAPASNANQHDRVAAIGATPINAAPSGALVEHGSARDEKKTVPAAVDNHVTTVTIATADVAASPPTKSVAPATKPAAWSTIRPQQDTASALVQSFTHAYAAGDLSAMMGLFTADAVNNRGGVEAISTDYDKLFHDTQSRELRLERLAWTTSEDRIVGSGPFEASIQRRGESEQRVDGWITIEARLIDGHWRIARIIHRNAR